MKVYLLLIIAIASHGLSFAQNNHSPNHANRFEAHLSGEVYIPPVIHSGSQWFISDWCNGSVILKTGEKVNQVLLRYNGFLDELFWLTPDNYDQIRLDKLLISSFVLNPTGSGQQLHFKNMSVSGILGGSRENVFMQVLYEGDISLFVIRKIRLTGGTTSVMVGDVLVPRQIIGPDYLYYLQRMGSEPEPILPNRRALINTFPEHRQEIRQALRRNHNRVRTEIQFIEAIAIIDRIIAAKD